ncbi:MAG: host specificity factor TipJ family phage tail protein [Acholeplasmataceae bacterium]
MGVGGFWAAVLTGVISAGVATGIYFGMKALIDMPSMAEQESFNRLAALTGQQNRLGAFHPIPRLYGRLRYYPPIPMTAQPYTETSGSNQYLRMFLCLGYGPLSIGGVTVGIGRPIITQATALTGIPIKIGETDIHEYDEVSFQIGRPDQMTLYTNEVLEAQPGWTTEYENPIPGWHNDGESFIQTSSPNASELSIDVWGSLFSVNESGTTLNAKVEWKIEYRVHGTTNWTLVTSSWMFSSSKRETIRLGYRWTVAGGQYDVRLTRVRTYHEDAKAAANEMQWVSLRTIRSTPGFTVPNTIVMALRIRATDQLQGSLDNVSVEATSVLPVWNGSAWVEQATRSPAWAYVDVLTGTASRRPLSKAKIDAAAMLAWATQTNTDEDYFDHIYDDSGTVFDRIRSISAAGRADWALRDDAIMTVVRDVPDTTPRMIISPRNSSGFRYEMSNADIPHALRVQFIDATTWENTERIVYDDGYSASNATLYQTIEAIGVTNPAQAWRLGRYHLAQMRMRPETYSFSQDIQYLRYTKGDLLQLQHDVIAVGLAAGRITGAVYDSITGKTTVSVDTYLAMVAGTSYAIRYQNSNGSIEVHTIETETPGTDEPVVVGNITPAADSHFVFGEVDNEIIDVKVLSIEPQAGLRAQVTCVPAALDILDAISGTIPPFDPVITTPIDPDKLPPPAPTIVRVASGDAVLIRDTDGTPRQRMLVAMTVASFPGWGDRKYQVRYRIYDDTIPDVDKPWSSTTPSTSAEQIIYDVEPGQNYEIQCRVLRERANKTSPWTASTLHLVEGVTSPPPDVTGLVGRAVSDQVILEWDPVTIADLKEYEIRRGSDWETASVAFNNILATSLYTGDVYPGPYMIKAKNTAGVLSVNPAVFELSITEPAMVEVNGAVVHNMVSLVWSAVPGTWPIRWFEVYRGAAKLGDVLSSYLTLSESTAGTYTYTVVPVDTAGNSGTSAFIELVVGDPSHAGGEQEFEFAKNTSLITPPTTGWVTSPPPTGRDEYLWFRVRYIAPDGTIGDWASPVRIKGDEGAHGLDAIYVVPQTGNLFRFDEHFRSHKGLAPDEGSSPELFPDGGVFGGALGILNEAIWLHISDLTWEDLA